MNIDFSRMLPASALILMMTLLWAPASFAGSVPWEVPVYGTAHQQDGLANTPIGTAQRKVAFRFRAQHTGHVESAIFYLIGGVGYSGGSGGTIRVQLRSDDAANPGFPSENVLGSTTVANPFENRPVVNFRTSPIEKSSDLFDLPYLEAGTLYHLVFVNEDPSPHVNYVSVNAAWMSVPQTPYIQPGVLAADLAVTMTEYGAAWVVREGFTPIYELGYWNGEVQGRSYQYGAEVHHPIEIDGAANRMVREVFTVTGGDRPGVGVYTRLKKVGDPSSLSLQLRKSSAPGVVVAGVNLAASAIPEEYSWVGGSIDYILEEGEEYFLMVKENSGGGVGHYLTYPVNDGIYYGFSTGFTEGMGQWYEGSGNWMPWRNIYSHLQFYIELAE